LISGSRDGAIIVWDWAQGRRRGVLAGHRAAVTGLALHPRGEHLISGGAGGDLLRWRSGTGQPAIAEIRPEQRPSAPGQAAPQDIPNAAAALDDADAKPPASKGRLAALLIIGIAILLLSLAALVKVLHRPQAQAETGDDPPARISFECSVCKRKLKVKPELEGKQVKCLCGALVRAPATDA
jgi:hypothetical protein